MSKVSNPEHRMAGAAARRAWDRVRSRVPGVEYAVKAYNREMVCSTPGAVLHCLYLTRLGDAVWATYLQVDRRGKTVRSLHRPATMADFEKYFRVYPESTRLLESKAVA